MREARCVFAFIRLPTAPPFPVGWMIGRRVLVGSDRASSCISPGAIEDEGMETREGREEKEIFHAGYGPYVFWVAIFAGR